MANPEAGPPWETLGGPPFTDEQVKWLEGIFPVRCLAPNEDVATHIRYAGKVELIAFLRARTPSGISEEIKAGATDDDALAKAYEDDALRELEENGPTPQES